LTGLGFRKHRHQNSHEQGDIMLFFLCPRVGKGTFCTVLLFLFYFLWRFHTHDPNLLFFFFFSPYAIGEHKKESASLSGKKMSESVNVLVLKYLL